MQSVGNSSRRILAPFSWTQALRQADVGQEDGGKSRASQLLCVRCVLSHLSGGAGDKWEATGVSCKGTHAWRRGQEGGREEEAVEGGEKRLGRKGR